MRDSGSLNPRTGQRMAFVELRQELLRNDSVNPSKTSFCKEPPPRRHHKTMAPWVRQQRIPHRKRDSARPRRSPRNSICGDIRRLSGPTGRNADFCLIGPTLGLKGWQTGLEPATAGTTIWPPLGGANSESRMASGFAPASVCRRQTSICGDNRRLSRCTGRNADFCLIGHTPGSKGCRRGSVQRQRAGRKSWNPDLQARHKRIPVALPAKMTLSRPRWGRARPSKRRRVGRLTPPWWWIGSDMPAGMRMQEIAIAGDYPTR